MMTVNEVKNHPAYLYLEKICEPSNGPLYGPIYNDKSVIEDMLRLGLTELIEKTCTIEVLRRARKEWPENWFNENRGFYSTNRRSGLLALMLRSAITEEEYGLMSKYN